MKVVQIFRTLTFITMALSAANVSAVIVEENVLSSGVGWSLGEFTVINDSSESIYAFAVANNNPYGAANSNTLGWIARPISASQWDAGDNYNFGFGDGLISTADFGLFSELFPGYNYAFLYAYGVLSSGVINPGDIVSGFEFETVSLGSPFVAVGSSGNVIATGQAVHVVPLPAAIWLFSFGIGLFGLLFRRK